MVANLKPVEITAIQSPEDMQMLQQIVDFVEYKPNALLTMVKKPGLLPLAIDLLNKTLRSDRLFSQDFKFLIGTETSRSAGCFYTCAHMAHATNHLGVAWQKLDELPNYASSSLFTEQEKVALDLANASGNMPMEPTNELFKKLNEFYSEDEIIEIVSCIAACGWFNRWNSIVQTDLESVPAEALKYVSWLYKLKK